MSRSAGPGSPITFMCAKLRSVWYLDRHALWDYHRVTRTGREKPRRGRGALGLRSDLVSREYVCSCGHRGWSNHSDLASMPLSPTDEVESRS